MYAPEKSKIFIGTYGSSEQPGIYSASFNGQNGTLELISSVDCIAKPSFLALHPSKPYLFAVSETTDAQGQPVGAVVSFRIGQNGLQMINRQLTYGTSACHVSIDPQGCMLFVTNYSGSNICSFLINEDGTIGEGSPLKHSGAANHIPSRQDRAHPHSSLPHPQKPYLLVADLGLDQLIVYRPEPEHNRLQRQMEIVMPAGMGPRHFTYHPSRSFLYVIGELNSSVAVLAMSEDGLRYEMVQSISTLPEGNTQQNYCADIHVSPCGSFLFGSNRGHDSLVVYRIDPETGLLSTIGLTPTGGQWPRNFAVSPDSRFVLVANQNSDNIVVFAFDQNTGELNRLSEIGGIHKPVCIIFDQA